MKFASSASQPVSLGVLGALLLLSIIPANAAVIFVNASAPPGGSGTSWATALASVQEGLAAARAGDQVWVAAGTYRGTATRRILVPNGVQLYGGFAGTETRLDQRNPQRHVTILDGNNGGTVVTIAPDATPETRLDGFLIQNGRAVEGGGVYVRGGSPVIANNVITRNEASNGGCGIFCLNSGARIVGNHIHGNTYRTGATPLGGGIRCDRGAPVIENNLIYGNAAYDGGGISCGRAAAVIRHNLILGNRAPAGGGIECQEAEAVIENNRIIGNTVHQDFGIGGAGV